MGVTNYHCVNGRLLGETRPTGERIHYLTDAIGSVIATMNDEGVVLNTYRYKPFGGILYADETDPTPRFLWAGTTGSRHTGLQYAEHYNLARHYGTRQAQWTTVDPLWPMEKAYAYVNANPTTWVDPLGLQQARRPSTLLEIIEDSKPKPVPIARPQPLWPVGPIVGPPRQPQSPSYKPGSPPLKPDLPFNPSLNPLTFGYGNCCGLDRRCSACDAAPGGRATDCIDRACAIHDQCLGTWAEYANPLVQSICAAHLCRAARACLEGEGCGDSADYAGCRKAAGMIARLYCAIGVPGAFAETVFRFMMDLFPAGGVSSPLPRPLRPMPGMPEPYEPGKPAIWH